MVIHYIQCALCSLLVSTAAIAQSDVRSSQPTALPATDAEVVVVTGHLPGPAMFRVSNGEDHVL